MQCQECGNDLIVKKKKPKLRLFCKESVIEFLGLILIGLSSSYSESLILQTALIILGIVSIVLGHKLMNRKVSFSVCKTCKTENDICTE